MRLAKALRITKIILQEHTNKPEPPHVEIVHLKPDGNMPKSGRKRVATNAGGLNIMLDGYTDPNPVRMANLDSENR